MKLTDDDKQRIEAEERERQRVRMLIEKGPVVIRVARGCRSGCGCLVSLFTVAIVLAIVLPIIFLFTGGGDSAGKAACESFYEFTALTGDANFNYGGVLGRVMDVRDLAADAGGDIQRASDDLRDAIQLEDTGRIIAAASAMGAACSEAGHSP